MEPHESFATNLVLSCKQVRRLDSDAIRDLQIPSLLLMENAARGAAEIILRERSWEGISIVCGPGNNGGDGLALARLLAAIDVVTSVFLIRAEKPLSSDAETNLRLLDRSGLPVIEPDLPMLKDHLNSLTPAHLIVDALLGTGIRGNVQPPFCDVIDDINASPAKVMSLDVPSGLDSDFGTACGTAVRANLTVTFAAMKKGMLTESAAGYCGDINVCHIGLPASWMRSWYARVVGDPDERR